MRAVLLNNAERQNTSILRLLGGADEVGRSKFFPFLSGSCWPVAAIALEKDTMNRMRFAQVSKECSTSVFPGAGSSSRTSSLDLRAHLTSHENEPRSLSKRYHPHTVDIEP